MPATPTPAKPGRVPAILGGPPALNAPIYLTQPRMPARARLDGLLDRLYDSRWLTNDGPLVQELQEHLRVRLGVAWCAVLCNGTTALQAALRALELDGEVLTTPFTFPATVHAIEWNGLAPVFCDVDSDTYDLDPRAAAAAVTDRTCALLPVHVFGNPCDVDGLAALAAAHDLRIAYDAAHAFGVEHQGRGIGAFGDLSVFSFHATKVFHTAEGGCVVGRDPACFARIKTLRNFAILNEDAVAGLGINGKMSELHAALGLAVLDQLDDEIAARGRLHARYRARLGDVPGLRLQRLAPATKPNHAYFTLEVDAAGFGLDRDTVHRALRAENVVARRYFRPLCSENPRYAHLPSAAPGHLPRAHRLASRILCLPLHGALDPGVVDRVADALLAIRNAAPRIRAAEERA